MPRETGWPTINPGKFRTPLTLLEPTAGSDASGVTVTYAPGSPAITIYADVEYLRGREALRAGQDVTQTILIATSWYRPEFTAQKRLQTAAGAQYIIQNVNNVREMGVTMELTCIGIGGSN